MRKVLFAVVLSLGACSQPQSNSKDGGNDKSVSLTSLFGRSSSCKRRLSRANAEENASAAYRAGNKKFFSLNSFGVENSTYYPGIQHCDTVSLNSFPSVDGLNNYPTELDPKLKPCRQSEYDYIVAYNQHLYDLSRVNAVSQCKSNAEKYASAVGGLVD